MLISYNVTEHILNHSVLILDLSKVPHFVLNKNAMPKTFFWFILPLDLAMILFIGLPIVSSFFQYIENEQVLWRWKIVIQGVKMLKM